MDEVTEFNFICFLFGAIATLMFTLGTIWLPQWWEIFSSKAENEYFEKLMSAVNTSKDWRFDCFTAEMVDHGIKLWIANGWSFCSEINSGSDGPGFGYSHRKRLWKAVMKKRSEVTETKEYWGKRSNVPS